MTTHAAFPSLSCHRATLCAVAAQCVDGTCVEDGAVAAGGPCPDEDECAPGTACTSGTCIEPGTLAAGRACARDADCQVALLCDRVCRLPGSVPAGALCGRDEACADGLPCVEARGTDGTGPRDGHCHGVGTLAEGQSCKHLDDCAAGLICRLWAASGVADGHCRTLAAAGQDCVGIDEACLPGLRCGCPRDGGCAGGGFACTGPVADGGACRRTLECAAGLACDREPALGSGTCRVPGGDEAPCRSRAGHAVNA